MVGRCSWAVGRIICEWVAKEESHKDCYEFTNWLIIPVPRGLEIIFLREEIGKKKPVFYSASLEASLVRARKDLKAI